MTALSSEQIDRYRNERYLLVTGLMGDEVAAAAGRRNRRLAGSAPEAGGAGEERSAALRADVDAQPEPRAGGSRGPVRADAEARRRPLLPLPVRPCRQHEHERPSSPRAE